MFPTLCSRRSLKNVLSLLLVLGVLGVAAARAQEPASARPVLEVDGNKVFTKQELLDVVNKCLDQYAETGYSTEKLDYCLHRLTNHMQEKGYLQAHLGKTLYEQNENVLQATIPVEEGAIYRLGEIKIEDAKVVTPAQILDLINLKPGEIVDAGRLTTALYERVKEAYGNLGYIQYTAEVTPVFHLKEGAEEGVADFAITIDEGQQFKIRSIKFTGGLKATTDLLQKELMVHDGEVFNHELWKQSIIRMNNSGLFDPIDADKDVDFKADEKAPLIDLIIRLKKNAAVSVKP